MPSRGARANRARFYPIGAWRWVCKSLFSLLAFVLLAYGHSFDHDEWLAELLERGGTPPSGVYVDQTEESAPGGSDSHEPNTLGLLDAFLDSPVGHNPRNTFSCNSRYPAVASQPALQTPVIDWSLIYPDTLSSLAQEHRLSHSPAFTHVHSSVGLHAHGDTRCAR
ncbi:uncharacterized protein LAESUDRAFT_502990 [Laetiporus sulphureus 93-53]|uniref:Uncharacterized protein n=1 Tax=Laetiporus sulphureus 93-53 TaxID=1314785 RepID=A0A165BFA3_9APHY|nr:uncharacterized protein LAESUDRAFT_502990 [Laetiporus sulphureus 93-53]KZT00931.1 hypothetical protein LAESUDRAFT_502990 [Laetiporus sulphureus 93-53]